MRSHSSANSSASADPTWLPDPTRTAHRLIHANLFAGYANLASQVSSGDFRPTEQAVAFKKEVMEQINQQLSQFRSLKELDIPALNKLIRDRNVDAISLPKSTPPTPPSS